jgi:phosphate transport system substrate-binding protein
VSGTLNGSGSTFQAPYDQVVIQAFQQAHSGVTINYQAKGSGGGQTDLGNQVVDFAASDVPESASQLPLNKGGAILYFPVVVAPVTVSYNLPGNPKLSLDAAVLAKIFSLKITNWDDPAIAADGNAKLPNLPITVVHRSDSSGTTANFTDFLNKADPTDWTLGTSKTINWASGTEAGNGNPGVANDIKAKSGAIGYVDFSDAEATNLTWAKVKNESGNYIDATLAGASAAASDATVNSDLTFDPIWASGAQDYPITSPTFIITYAKYTDASKVALLQAFLNFILGSTGQGLSNNQNLGFAPLPTALDTKALAQVPQITAG